MKRYLSVVVKGMAMGAADVVPGVSGGTIAFITGIYEELIGSIGKCDASALTVLRKDGFVAFFRHINGAFLLSVGIGIAISIVSLARIMTELLQTEPIKVWSFFFGLILASAVFVGKDIQRNQWQSWLAVALGTIIAYGITTISPAGGEVGLLYVFLSGAIAICAMILPGISGSFILLLLGAYSTVFGAIGHFTEDIQGHAPVIIAFAAGAGIGLLSFAKLLQWLFKTHKSMTMATLTGFMLGSLNKVWPWKEVLSTRINSKGEEEPLLEASILPANYEQIYGIDPQLSTAGIFFLVGLLIVFIMARFSPKDA